MTHRLAGWQLRRPAADEACSNKKGLIRCALQYKAGEGVGRTQAVCFGVVPSRHGPPPISNETSARPQLAKFGLQLAVTVPDTWFQIYSTRVGRGEAKKFHDDARVAGERWIVGVGGGAGGELRVCVPQAPAGAPTLKVTAKVRGHADVPGGTILRGRLRASLRSLTSAL